MHEPQIGEKDNVERKKKLGLRIDRTLNMHALFSAEMLTSEPHVDLDPADLKDDEICSWFDEAYVDKVQGHFSIGSEKKEMQNS